MIQVKNLTKSYGPRTAVSDLSFEVQPGEIIGFLGPNGAGKSTTMKILSGFMPATSGTAIVAGYDVFDKPLEVKARVGYLPENPPVYNEMVVSDYLLFAAELHNLQGANARKAVDASIEKTGLGSVRKRIIGNLSKGYRQRVGLAQALTHNPQVLILDEPTVGFDPMQIIEIRQVIKGLAGDHTVILSSHILPEVTATCQRVVVINQGKIVAQDTIESLTGRMAGNQSYWLEARTISAAHLSTLRAIPGVADLRQEGQRLEISVQGGADIREKLLATAVGAGMGVVEFAPSRLSLEEVFVKLTTEDAHV